MDSFFVTESDDDDNIVFTKQIKRKILRKANIIQTETEEEPSETEQDSSEEEPLETEYFTEEEQEEELSEPVKRGRGRPRKIIVDDGIPKIKRGRGRPVVDPIQLENGEIVSKTKDPRYHEKYYQINKERITRRIPCEECGQMMNSNNVTNHRRTEKHRILSKIKGLKKGLKNYLEVSPDDLQGVFAWQ